jgi:putative NADH-flavin reductase
MKITIFGSTGKTGILLVKQALAEGHEIVAFTRNPQKIQFTDSKLSVFEGNSLDAPAVTEAINSSDAVISLIGVNPKSEEFTFYKSMNNIVEAMRKNSVKRLIFSAGAGVGDPLDKGGFLGKLMTGIIKLVARNAYEDGLKTADYIRQQEDIDWSMIWHLLC